MFFDKYKVLTFTVLVIGYLSYSFTIYSSLPQKINSGESAIKGKQLWQSYNCGACHQVYGLGGYLGPDLTNTYSLKGAAYIRAFLKTGTNIMPNFKLSDAEMLHLIDYMKDMDASGIASPASFKINIDGTIDQ